MNLQGLWIATSIAAVCGLLWIWIRDPDTSRIHSATSQQSVVGTTPTRLPGGATRTAVAAAPPSSPPGLPRDPRTRAPLPRPAADAEEEIRREVVLGNHARLADAREQMADWKRTRRAGGGSAPALTELAAALYADTLTTRALEPSTSAAARQRLLWLLEREWEIDAAELAVESEHLSDTYLTRLRRLLAAIANDPPASQQIPLLLEADDLLKRRKRLSDNYFKTEINDFFSDSGVALYAKVDYAREVTSYADPDLSRYALDYFRHISEQDELDARDREVVEELLHDAVRP